MWRVLLSPRQVGNRSQQGASIVVPSETQYFFVPEDELGLHAGPVQIFGVVDTGVVVAASRVVVVGVWAIAIATPSRAKSASLSMRTMEFPADAREIDN